MMRPASTPSQPWPSRMICSTSVPERVSAWASSSGDSGRSTYWVSHSRETRSGIGQLPRSFKSKLADEAEVVLEECAQVVDLVLEHRDAVRPHAEGEAGV